jgi:hypothetical protein
MRNAEGGRLTLRDIIMSKILRSVLVVAALVGAASSASAGGYHGYDHGYAKKHQTTLVFFDWLRKNGN